MPLTVFSQLKADKKIDTFYCFGPHKAKEIIKTSIQLEQVDSMLNDCEIEVLFLRESAAMADSQIYTINKINKLQKDIIQQQEAQKIDLNDKYEAEKSEKNKYKRKLIGAKITGLASITANIILLILNFKK